VKDDIKDTKGRYNAISFNTEIVKGVLGNARFLNGKDSYVKTPLNFKGWKSLAISLWVKPEQKDGGGLSIILDNGHDASNNFVIQSANSDNPNRGRWVFHCNGVDILFMLPFNQWTHLAIVVNAEKGIIQVDINGENVGKRTIDGGFEFGDIPLSFGRLSKVADRYFKGSIDEVKILGVGGQEE